MPAGQMISDGASMPTMKEMARNTRVPADRSLVYAESFDTKEEAQKRECQIKKMRRIQRLALIQSGMEHEALTALLEDINKKEQ